MGLDIYLHNVGAGPHPRYPDDPSMSADMDSATDPEHMFKRNYLRSSYNPSGFNNVVGNLTGKDLYWVFEPTVNGPDAIDDYDRKPSPEAWEECLVRAKTLLEEMRKAEHVEADFYSAQNLFAPDRAGAPSGEVAIDVWREEVAKHAGDERMSAAYSNIEGTFFHGDPLKVKAIVPGKGVLGDRGVWVIIETNMEWYVQGTEIVIEFIETAIANPGATMTWSG